ncbi:hypothetical protein L0657_25100 [Dyadobacter sp. CY345]|uniref:hypothetical protein n=1 Tax=Dyadobacter sp. CY345 TaxID=2909335 RepID=UPI001F3A3ED0|nr:hypothetical protein [Dyadobacter sp. CY345]MCF2447257.1 hypothetical protein [Dyadobacter sp. CY345]
MKRFILCVSAMLALSRGVVYASADIDEKDKKAVKKARMLREFSAYVPKADSVVIENGMEDFKPSIHVGAIVHMFASTEQTGFGGMPSANARDWNKGFSVYRARVLVGGQLSKKGSFFMETDLPSPIGIQLGDGTKNVKVAPIILDAQYEYDFSNSFQLIAGMQLVSNNRNGLQGAAGLMANDFTYFQYPYNMFGNSPLQGNFGRDLGVNARGFLLKDKLEYRLGVFTGRNLDGQAPLRIVGRVAYNFLDPEKDYYYAGTKLGAGNTFAWAAGFDTQGKYYNVGTDVFIDKKAGNPGSVTLNAAFQYMTGGTNVNSKYSFAGLIPRQTVQFLELGYYFTKSKLQPWIRYENQNISSKKEQVGSELVGDFDKAKSSSVYGGGLNYFFNGNNTNLRLSYVARQYNMPTLTGDYDKKSYGQFWLQVQFFIF